MSPICERGCRKSATQISPINAVLAPADQDAVMAAIATIRQKLRSSITVFNIVRDSSASQPQNDGTNGSRPANNTFVSSGVVLRRFYLGHVPCLPCGPSETRQQFKPSL